MFLQALGTILAILAVIAAYIAKDSFVSVDEGHLGFFYFGGKLLDEGITYVNMFFFLSSF